MDNQIFKEKAIKIAITGTESTGKSTLSKDLALYYKGAFIPEFARNFLTRSGNQYTETDIHYIARRQMEREEIVENCLLKKRGNQHQFLFVDTELINIKIWLEDKNWDIPPWIEEKLQTQHYDHYLMMNIDLPWVSDGLRTFPYRRQELYEKFIELLVYYKKSFSIIDGIGAKRKQNAIDVINSLYF